MGVRSRHIAPLVVGATVPWSGILAVSQVYIFTFVALVWLVVGRFPRIRQRAAASLFVVLLYGLVNAGLQPLADFRPVVVPAFHAVLSLLVIGRLSGHPAGGLAASFTRGYLYGAGVSALFAGAQRLWNDFGEWAVVTVYDRSNPNRFAGLSFHPNQLSLYCAVGLVVLLVRPDLLSGRRFLVVVSALSLGLMLGGSRTGFLCVGVALVVAAARKTRSWLRHPRVRPIALLRGGGLLTASLAALALTDWYLVRRFTENAGNTGDDLRVDFVNASLEHIRTNPIFGSGFPERLYHSVPLSVVAGLGVVGALLWTNFVWQLVRDYAVHPRHGVLTAYLALGAALVTTQEIHLTVQFFLVVPFMVPRHDAGFPTATARRSGVTAASSDGSRGLHEPGPGHADRRTYARSRHPN